MWDCMFANRLKRCPAERPFRQCFARALMHVFNRTKPLIFASEEVFFLSEFMNLIQSHVDRFYHLIIQQYRLIKYSLDNLRPIRTAEAFEAVDWFHQQTWLHCGIA